MFRERKAAQIAAWFLERSKDQSMEVMKLVKLMYLADRQAMEAYGFPLTGDRPVSMQHGPVLSQTYDYINGGLDSGPDGWDCWISDREGRRLSLADRKDFDLDELSPADERVLAAIWEKFGSMTSSQLRNFTHDRCPEWVDPEGSSRPIPFARIFEALGLSQHDSAAAAERIEEQDRIDRVFASL